MHITGKHWFAVFVCPGWSNYPVFSATLDTLLPYKGRSSIVLAAVTHCGDKMVETFVRENRTIDMSEVGMVDSLFDLTIEEWIVFWDGKDLATKNMIDSLRQRQLKHRVVWVEILPDYPYPRTPHG